MLHSTATRAARYAARPSPRAPKGKSGPWYPDKRLVDDVRRAACAFDPSSDALVYQQLNQDRVPSGPAKRIPFTSMQFVGPFDETQFVIICTRRSCERTYTPPHLPHPTRPHPTHPLHPAEL